MRGLAKNLIPEKAEQRTAAAAASRALEYLAEYEMSTLKCFLSRETELAPWLLHPLFYRALPHLSF